MKPWKLIVGILVVVGLGVAYWLISPLWRVEHVSEALPETVPAQNQNESLNGEGEQVSPEEPVTLYSGSFTGFDKIHTGSGTARIISVNGKEYVRFDENFVVNNGPDLFVGFGKNGSYIKGSDISPLKGTAGSQNYELPDGFDAAAYNEVWIWCRAFSVPFARAVLVQE